MRSADDLRQLATNQPSEPQPGWSGRVWQRSDAATAFMRGKERYEARDLVGARPFLEEAVRLDPEHDEARALLGWHSVLRRGAAIGDRDVQDGAPPAAHVGGPLQRPRMEPAASRSATPRARRVPGGPRRQSPVHRRPRRSRAWPSTTLGDYSGRDADARSGGGDASRGRSDAVRRSWWSCTKRWRGACTTPGGTARRPWSSSAWCRRMAGPSGAADRARVGLSQGRPPRDARVAFQRALALAPGSTEAARGLWLSSK